MAFLIPSIQFFFGLPRAVFCFGIHLNAILGNLPSICLSTNLYFWADGFNPDYLSNSHNFA
jgi:hypothetical protein